MRAIGISILADQFFAPLRDRVRLTEQLREKTMKPILIKYAIDQFGQLVSASETSCMWRHYCVHCSRPMQLVEDGALRYEFFMHDSVGLEATPWKICPWLYQTVQEEKNESNDSL